MATDSSAENTKRGTLGIRMEIDDLAHDLGYGPDEYEVADTEYVRGGDLIVHFKEAE